MKTSSLIFAASVLLSLSAIAQPAKNHGYRKQKTEAQKIAFLTHHLDLTPGEAQKFWPVYNQYQHEMATLKQDFLKKSREQKMKTEELSEKEMEENIMSEMEFAQKKLDLKKQYHPKFKEVLPVRKLARLYKAEKMFRKKMKEKRSAHHVKPGPPPAEDKF